MDDKVSLSWRYPVKLSQRGLIGFLAIIICMNIAGCNLLFSPGGEVVKRVSDGDTLTVKDEQGKDLTVRFACIDAPEVPHSRKERESKRTNDRNQFAWGEKAQQKLESLVKQGGDRVKLTITDSDRYGRKVAEVRTSNGTFAQEVLVREGLALVYRPYLNKCPSRDIIEAAEAEAQQKKRGVWSDSKFTKPWEYRSLNKKSG